jgi:broad specificity phosphatase PhoE
MKTKIYIVRHGQSIGNLNRRILGHTDLDLTENGYLEAQKCADFMKETPIDIIYSSDLQRAYNTALPHAKIRSLLPIKSKELRELYFGDWEGVSVNSVEETELFKVSWREGFGTFTAPNGESVKALADRIYSFIFRKAMENEGKSMLFVFHAAAIRAFWGRISHIPCEILAQKLQFPINASVSFAEYENGEITPIEYSNASFL